MLGFTYKFLHNFGKSHPPNCSIVVVAAGSSQRMGGVNKIFADIGGVPVLARTLAVLENANEITEIIVVAGQDSIEDVANLCGKYSISKAGSIVCGGNTRLESAYNGVCAVSCNAKLIAIHDGARPLVTQDIILNVIKAAEQFSAAVPAVPVSSTIKRAADGIVTATVDRNGLFEVQTPQVFHAEMIKAALEDAVKKKLDITDDSMAVEAAGIPVRLTAGAKDNIKITVQEDIILAEAIIRKRGEE